MHDAKAFRRDPDAFRAAMVFRGVSSADVDALFIADTAKRAIEAEVQALQARRNALAQLVATSKRSGHPDEAIITEAKGVGDRLAALARDADRLALDFATCCASMPNTAAEDVPEGRDETRNVVVKVVGDADRKMQGTPHWESGVAFGLDIPAGVALAGSRFCVLRGPAARLDRALGQFMLDLHISEHGYEETAVPHLVNADALFGTGQLPKFAQDLFAAGSGRYLVPTAEVPLTNLAKAHAVDPATPQRLVALSPCYRAEAGSSGRDVRGVLRQHQFHKVELVTVIAPELAEAEHERMTTCAERVLELLELPYRRVLLCSGDMGFSAAKTFDLEVWMPGQGVWREISSCSNCGDFQARRMGVRMKGRKDLPHTLNGSGVAIGRAFAAMLENHMQEDGSLRIPAALQGWLGGADRLQPRQGLNQD